MPTKLNVHQRITLKKRTTTPKLPGSNELTVFASSDGSLKVVDDAGTVSVLHTVLIKKRTTDLARTSEASLVADPELTFTDLPIGFYEMEAFFLFDNGDGGASWGSGGLTGGLLSIRQLLDENDEEALNEWDNSPATGIQPEEAKGLLEVTAVGDWSIAWSQSVSDVSPTTLKAGSYVKLTKL